MFGGPLALSMHQGTLTRRDLESVLDVDPEKVTANTAIGGSFSPSRRTTTRAKARSSRKPSFPRLAITSCVRQLSICSFTEGEQAYPQLAPLPSRRHVRCGDGAVRARAPAGHRVGRSGRRPRLAVTGRASPAGRCQRGSRVGIAGERERSPRGSYENDRSISGIRGRDPLARDGLVCPIRRHHWPALRTADRRCLI